MWRDEALFLDMLLAAQDAQDFLGGMNWDDFSKSALHQSAVIRCLEVIGEAATKVSAEARAAHPEIPWREIAGMRHRLIHAYREVDLEIVWSAARNRLPELIVALRPLIPPPQSPGS